MIQFTTPVALLLIVPLCALAVALWRNGYVNLTDRRRAVALATRLLLISLIVLGLAGFALRLPQSRQAVVFVADRSASDAGSTSAMETLIGAAATQRPGDDEVGIVSVGRDAVVEQPVSQLGGFDHFETAVNGDYTNLERGLELAAAISPNGYRRRVVLLSDGQQNAGDALNAARLLRSEGMRVDVMPVHVPGGPDVLVGRVDMPSQLRPEERFTLAVSLQSNVDTTTSLTVYRDRSLVLSRQERVHSGDNTFLFDQRPLRPGFHTYSVQITPALDSQPENNVGSAYTTVQGPPRVLVITDVRTKAANVMASLRSTGIQADLQQPADVVPTLGYLQRYAAVVIVDTSADVIGPDLADQLVPYVRDLGRGLVVIGGEESYGMGGYGQTPLEQALPVNMDLPKRKDLPSAAVALVIESLESDTDVNISKEAGKGVIKMLTQQDQVAVNDAPDDNTSGWVVPLQSARNKGTILQAIDQMQPGDPMSYADYLRSAYLALKHTTARVKHIILLGDGDATDDYEALVRKIRAGGVTVSTVATNSLGMSDFQTMRDIARWGGGRYYQADNTASIPQIFLREARTVARSGIIEGKFYPQELSVNPMLRDVRAVPPLYGYVATTPKPSGELVLVSKKLDPVLAGWQFGLGRAVAWTSDATGRWTRDWLQAPGANRFWANLVSWTLPATQAGHLFVTTGSAQGQGQVSVQTPAGLGANPDVTARVIDPGLQAANVQLQPYAPGRYRGQFEAKTQGAYFVTVEAHGAGHGAAGQAGLAVPYSAEYRTIGTNAPFLRTLAAAGGGSIIRGPQDAWRDNLSGVYDQRSLSGLLWLLALLLLPVDIGVRRLILSRQDLVVFRDALRLVRPAATAGEPMVAPLNVLRTRRARVRGSAAGGSSGSQAGAVPIQTDGTARPESGSPAPSAAPTRAYAPASPLGGRSHARTAPVPPPPPAETAPSAEPEESTAGRLLAAKRRRR